MIEIECQNCGEMFSVAPSRSAARYCSTGCYRDAGIRGRPRIHTHFECAGCGRRVELGPGERRRKYCSYRCQASRSRVTSAEERAKISARMRERWKDPKTRLLYLRTTGSSVAAAKRRAALKASGAEDELARKRSENQKRRWADPATRARLETAMKRPETRQRMRAAAGVRNASARTMKLYARPDGEIVALRSSWEADFAEFADRLGIRWTYEEHRFVLSDGHSITPDFRVSAPGFGDFHVELHRILNVKPGDERKVERLKRAVGEVSEYRLLNERDVVSMQAALRRLRRDAQRGD